MPQIDPNNMDSLIDLIVGRVIERIAEHADEGDDLGGLLPDDLGGEQMGAGVGPGFTPGMAGAGDDGGGVDEFDDLGDDDAMPGEGDDGLGDDEGDDAGGGEPADDMAVGDGGGDDEEDEERYQAGPMPGPGSRVRNDTRSTGKPMSTTQYQADPGTDGVALDRYQADDAERVRYRQAFARFESDRKADRKTIAGLQKQLERYASSHNDLVAELNRRDRMDALKDLVAEGFDLDIEEELSRTERYSHEDFDREVERIRVRYRRSSEGDEFVPAAPPLRGQDDVPFDHTEMVRYSKTIESELPRSAEHRAEELARRYREAKKAGQSF